uniref:Uncharacterized protein n=1 Tax=Pseudomonas phage HRDY3 TaxID=3236930 RepID=A0AB39CEF3_9VIRU
MKPFKFAKSDLTMLRQNCTGATITCESDSVAIAKVKGNPFVRVEVDTTNALRLTVRVFRNDAWHRFMEVKSTFKENDKHAQRTYSAGMFGDDFPKAFADLNETQREHVLQWQRTHWVDLEMDEVTRVLEKTLFSKTPVMPTHVYRFPKCYSKAVLKAFKVDTSAATAAMQE